MEATIVNLLIFIACFVWLGIGFISSMVLNTLWYKKSTQATIIPFVRACMIVFWPILMIGFIIDGVHEDLQ